MADLLEKASSWLQSQRTRHCSKKVTYVRGELSIEVDATIGRTIFQSDDGAGAVIRFESRDFLILAADLVLAGQVILPEEGDQIRESAGERVYVYEVSAPEGEMAWRYNDPYRQTLRIHSKQVEGS